MIFSPEFINLVSSESNEVCSREDKRTIAPEHVIQALKVSYLSPFTYSSGSNLFSMLTMILFFVSQVIQFMLQLQNELLNRNFIT